MIAIKTFQIWIVSLHYTHMDGLSYSNSNCIKSTIPLYRRSSENHMIMLMNGVLPIHTASKVITVRDYDCIFFKCGAFLKGWYTKTICSHDKMINFTTVGVFLRWFAVPPFQATSILKDVRTRIWKGYCKLIQILTASQTLYHCIADCSEKLNWFVANTYP